MHSHKTVSVIKTTNNKTYPPSIHNISLSMNEGVSVDSHTGKKREKKKNCCGINKEKANRTGTKNRRFEHESQMEKMSEKRILLCDKGKTDIIFK